VSTNPNANKDAVRRPDPIVVGNCPGPSRLPLRARPDGPALTAPPPTPGCALPAAPFHARARTQAAIAGQAKKSDFDFVEDC
jgi:hypothetical protein